MLEKRIDLWKKQEYTYEGAYGFSPFMMAYFHEDDKKRPAMMIVPGGGYRFVSPSEARPVANVFYKAGYQVFVVVYTINLFAKPLKMQPLQDVSRAIRMIRKNAETYGVKENQIGICGFSAGGHLSGSLCVHCNDVEDCDTELQSISNRPDAAILAYPVISAGKYAHRDSFCALLGDDPTDQELQYMSLEYQVTSNMPPCFLWQTVTDATVPVENSYLFANACKNAEVPFAHHIFSEGMHGMSVANEEWLQRTFSYPYSLEQVQCAFRMLKKERTLGEAKNVKMILEKTGILKSETIKITSAEQEKIRKDMIEVGIWPDLALRWLEKVWNE